MKEETENMILYLAWIMSIYFCGIGKYFPLWIMIFIVFTIGMFHSEIININPKK
jgi:hypothetical protein